MAHKELSTQLLLILSIIVISCGLYGAECSSCNIRKLLFVLNNAKKQKNFKP